MFNSIFTSFLLLVVMGPLTPVVPERASGLTPAPPRLASRDCRSLFEKSSLPYRDKPYPFSYTQPYLFDHTSVEMAPDLKSKKRKCMSSHRPNQESIGHKTNVFTAAAAEEDVKVAKTEKKVVADAPSKKRKSTDTPLRLF